MLFDAPIRALSSVPGHYEHEAHRDDPGSGSRDRVVASWSYTYDIARAGTPGEHRTGTLTLEGVGPAGARRGDRLETPWGAMQLMEGPGETGWLLAGAYGRPLDPIAGTLLGTPEGALASNGRWKGSVGRWRWEISVSESGHRGERIVGRVFHADREILAASADDRLETPWGRLAFQHRARAEGARHDPREVELYGARGAPRRAPEVPGHFGWLPVEPGDAAGRVLPIADDPVLPALRIFRSPYLRGSALEGHGVAITVDPRLDAADWEGVLIVEPNVCTLGPFGDRDACSRAAPRRHEVRISRVRVEDPRHRGRRLFQVSGAGVPRALSLITDPAAGRAYLKLDEEIISLEPDPR